MCSSDLTALPAIFGTYRRKYPKVNLQLQESYTSGVIDGLLKGTLDAGIVRDGGATPGLEVETLFSEPFVAVLSNKHRLAKQRSLSPRDLRDEPFVFYPPYSSKLAYEKPLSICEAHGFRPKVVQEAPQWLTILRLVGAGLGVSIAPACVERIAAPDVVCRRLRGTKMLSDIELAYRSGEDRPIVRSFSEIVRGGFLSRRK